MSEPQPATHEDSHAAIHLPPPSIWPVVLAIGIALLLTGLVVSLVLLVIGVLISLAATALWVRDARREFEALPE